MSFLLSFIQSCGHFPALMPGDSVSKSESFSVRNIFLCSRFSGTDCSRSLIILSLMNRTQPVCTIFRFSQTSADGLTRKIRMEDGKGSPLQMAGRLRCRSRRQRRQRKCFLCVKPALCSEGNRRKSEQYKQYAGNRGNMEPGHKSGENDIPETG